MSMRRVAILSVGDELVLGQIDDSNARWLAQHLQTIGCAPSERRTVTDDITLIARAMGELAATHFALIVTGGLGPTRDDLTRDALLEVVDQGGAFVQDADAIAHLHAWFEGRGRVMPPTNLRQALRPASARMLANPLGTAPGIAATSASGCMIFCLPGPPSEMRPMFDACVAPLIRDHAHVVLTAALHTVGLGESSIGERLGSLMARDREPSVGTTASDGIVSVRVRSSGLEADARAALELTINACREQLGDIIFGRDDETLAAVVGAMLHAKQLTLATAESCTGGLIGSMITDVAGSSAFYRGGFITYENARKTADLGVAVELLELHGAVSHEVAMSMARGALRVCTADIAIATTGIAGPSGGSVAKPVGTVYIAIALRGSSVISRRFAIPGDRAAVRRRSALLALASVRTILLGAPTKNLLWSEAEAPRVEAL